MPIEFIGKEEKSSKHRFCCKIEVDDEYFYGFIVNKYYEYDIQYNNNIFYSARFSDISKFNFFLNRLTLTYTDFKVELFRIRSSGIFWLGRIIELKDQNLKIPRKLSFSLPEIGFEIRAKRDTFYSSISNVEDIGIGIGLSYFIWLQQQRWNNMV